MAVSTLVRQGEDKITRQAYLRRQDEIYFYNKNLSERDEYKRRAEQEQRRAELAESALEEKNTQLEEKDAENERLRRELADLKMRHTNP